MKTRKTVIKGSLVTSSLIRETTENACDLNSQEFMEKLGELSGSLSLRKKDFKKI